MQSLNVHRKLRTGTPVWMAYRTPIPRARKLMASCKTDVLVVGAGISGILVAHALASRGKRVIIVDRRGPLQGSTPASTSLLQFEIDTPLIRLRRMVGTRPANAAWLRSLAALRSLRATISAQHIHANVAVRRSLLLAGPSLDASALAAEARARQGIGLPSQYLSGRALRRDFGLQRQAAIVSEENLIANPRALGAGLLRRALAAGARLRAPHEIVDLDANSRRVVARTQDGMAIECGHAVFCCGYEMPAWVPTAGHRIASTWVMATRAQPHALWPEAALIWEAAEPYLYVRATADGRVICGGEDEPYSDAGRRDSQIGTKTRILERKLRELMPQLDTRAQFSWTGSFGQSSTGLPTIGAIPALPRCFAVLGYGGNGITFSALAAQLIAKAIFGDADEDQALFAFDE
jgi:glycine/D-amino acid oxidase-like deaminating enzyme